ncbi:LAFA_0F05952g1_1 [Lachancea sp. 'fantastica']|nr:LAFA_0F05952g1_1 [Lachancea sp. 'fantastica']
MTAECERQPLGRVSESRMNQRNGLTMAELTGKSSARKLPSITSIIHEEPESGSEAQGSEKHTERHTDRQDIDFDEVSRKLKIRMQMAYYKYRTKQTRLSFRQVDQSTPSGGVLKMGVPKDKKKGIFSAHNKASSGVGKPARRLVMSQGSLRTPVKPSAVSGGRTPLRPLDANQTTPMSVKAAKSLINLFTSKQ